MRNAHYRTCNMSRKPKHVEKDTHRNTHTQTDRQTHTHTHYWTWNMARNTEKCRK